MSIAGTESWRAWYDRHEARLRERFLGSPAATSALTTARRVGNAFGYELRQSQRAAPRREPLTDSRGRRLRASAAQGGAVAAWHQLTNPVLRPFETETIASPLIKLAIVLLAAVVGFMSGSMTFINFASTLPDVHGITTQALPEDTIIYAADGTQLADIHEPGAQRYYQTLPAMGSLLPSATVAIEDANFYKEQGIDPTGIARAAWIDWRQHGVVQGASTITQQLVKLRLVGNEPSIERKAKEAVLAVQLDHSYSKQQILELYLNTIHYSNNALGAAAAAKLYFHKETKDLDLAQASMLAGIPQNPNVNDPFRNWDQAKFRQSQVLDAMVRNSLTTRDAADQAYNEDLTPPNHMFRPTPMVQGPPGFTGWVIGQLIQRYGRAATYDGGLRVTTTLNRALQAQAEKISLDNVNADRSKNMSQGAMAAIDPRSGAVIAMVGAADPNGPGHEYNMAVIPRNPGSSMKIWTYTAAIESQKFSATTPIADTAVAVKQPGQADWKPENYDHRLHGTCALQACMGNSLNIPAVKVELGVGLDKVVDVARRAGAPPGYPRADGTYDYKAPADSYPISTTLGSVSETVLSQANGAATIAAMGVYHPAYGIQTVKTAEGKDVFVVDPAKEAKQVLDPRVAFIMATIMSDDNNRVPTFPRGVLTLPDRRIAGKTGTTDDFKDAWTVGYSPSLASAFWFGNTNSTPMQQGFDAIFAASPAFHNFMAAGLETLNAPKDEWYGPPPGLDQQGGIYLMPGTKPGMTPPALPAWAISSGTPTPKPTPKKPGG
ncbi:MAG: transglycosylase domain-containing protein [Candidatus Dormibacter sp.]|uniref:transglycosylase domain-containing protein n=1 Tax=Candidatus Dormibacter sp. TaxID=2973982 RepID=UPI000DB8AAED|nr:MAG: hypothetical protein DLM66_09710 [Candidatus Dormibacteraeota bacterium]